MAFFLMLMQMLPTILGLVTQIDSIAGSGNGAAKKALLLNTVLAAAGAAPNLVKTIGSHDLAGTVGNIIDVAVTGLKVIPGAMIPAGTPPAIAIKPNV